MKARKIILYTWTICYLLILLSYCLIISKTLELSEALGYFGITNAIILPQLVVILGFFYNKTEKEMQVIIEGTPFAKFAVISSILFITMYTILVILAYPVPVISDGKYDIFGKINDWYFPNASVTIAKIMGNVMFFSTGALTYLFTKNDKHPRRKSAPSVSSGL